jgi:DNA-binding transcriptional ArsR family regulator
MSVTGPLGGDVPITDPQAMRALAHPVRLAVLSYLQHNGPATATILSPHVGATPSVTSWHLRHLATFGLVGDADPEEVPGDRRQRWWQALRRGFRFEAAQNPASQGPAGQMYSAAARAEADHWAETTWPRLGPEWMRVAGLSRTTVRLTVTELEKLTGRIDELLAPFVHREEPPADARSVRILRYCLPEAES